MHNSYQNLVRTLASILFKEIIMLAAVGYVSDIKSKKRLIKSKMPGPKLSIPRLGLQYVLIAHCIIITDQLINLVAYKEQQAQNTQMKYWGLML